MRKFLRSSKSEVSVIIVNYNTGRLLSECAASIKQSAKTEIIVVDNASTDGSVDQIKNLKIKSQNYKSKLKIIHNQTNLGFAKAVNQGIEAAQGKYILLLNPDTKIRLGAIEKMVEFAESTPDAGVIGARLVNPDGSVQPSVFHFPTFWSAIKEFWLGQKNSYSKYVPEGKQPIEVDVVVGAAFLITPVAIRVVGLFDERFFMYFEDLDYCKRVKQRGLKVYYLPQAEVVHYHGFSGRGQDLLQQQRLVGASRLYHGLIKHYIINFIIWSGQKWKKLFKIQN